MGGTLETCKSCGRIKDHSLSVGTCPYLYADSCAQARTQELTYIKKELENLKAKKPTIWVLTEKFNDPKGVYFTTNFCTAWLNKPSLEQLSNKMSASDAQKLLDKGITQSEDGKSGFFLFEIGEGKFKTM